MQPTCLTLLCIYLCIYLLFIVQAKISSLEFFNICSSLRFIKKVIFLLKYFEWSVVQKWKPHGLH